MNSAPLGKSASEFLTAERPEFRRRLSPCAVRGILAAAVAIPAVAIYWRTLSFPFSVLDDYHNILQNPPVRSGLSAEAVQWAFRIPDFTYWQPLSWLSHMGAVSAFGLEPIGHHAVNVFLHVANTLIVLFSLGRMTGSYGRSAIVALLFAVHPLRVEPVAWVSGRTDLLSTLFFLLGLWAYAAYAARGGLSRYLPIVLLSLGAQMAKPTAIVFPFALLLLDWWPLERIVSSSRTGLDAQICCPSPGLRSLALEKVPFLLTAAGITVIAFVSRLEARAFASFADLSGADRASIAFANYVGYLAKAAWPANLSVAVGRIQPVMSVILSATLLLALSAGAWFLRRRCRWIWFGWLWYLVFLLPVCGLFQSGSSAAADRYTYLPLLGIFISVVWSAAEIADRFRIPKAASLVAACAALAALGIVSIRQVEYWRDDIRLFTHTLAIDPEDTLANNSLGCALLLEGRDDEAMDYFRRSIRIFPGDGAAHHNLGNILVRKGDFRSAIPHLQEAVRLSSNYVVALCDLGIAYSGAGQEDAAESSFREALRRRPGDDMANYQLGSLLSRRGRYEAAAERYRAALRWRPEDAVAHSDLGTALGKLGRYEEAAREFREAIRIDPSMGSALNNLGMALMGQGRPEEAAEMFRKAQVALPDDWRVKSNLADALRASGSKEPKHRQ